MHEMMAKYLPREEWRGGPQEGKRSYPGFGIRTGGDEMAFSVACLAIDARVVVLPSLGFLFGWLLCFAFRCVFVSHSARVPQNQCCWL